MGKPTGNVKARLADMAPKIISRRPLAKIRYLGIIPFHFCGDARCGKDYRQ
ncbi:hypothetical protein LJB86_04525 [Deltaproteobacteria bacterium OttesenSCG-928-M10]|nr:hypothetical protein [Deltaproteobacteria bacterium OttesenSCG-928-M10]